MTQRHKGQNYKFLTTPLSRNSQNRLEPKENQTKYRKMTRIKAAELCQNFNMWNVGSSTHCILIVLRCKQPRLCTQDLTKNYSQLGIAGSFYVLRVVFVFSSSFILGNSIVFEGNLPARKTKVSSQLLKSISYFTAIKIIECF